MLMFSHWLIGFGRMDVEVKKKKKSFSKVVAPLKLVTSAEKKKRKILYHPVKNV